MLGFLAVFCLFILFFGTKSAKFKGKFGEFLIKIKLKKITDYNKCLFNCYIPIDNERMTEVDVILLHRTGIYVFESKNYKGWIFGNENDRFWCQSLCVGKGKFKKYRFFNPILQNELHIKYLKKYLNEDFLDFNFHSYIVFGDKCDLRNVKFNSERCNILKRKDLFYKINGHFNSENSQFSNEEIDILYKELLPLTKVSRETKQKHIQNIIEKYKMKS